MPLDDAETFSRTLQQYRKAVTDLQQTVPHIGTERDQNARERVRRLRTLVSTLEGKLDDMLPADDAARDRAWDDLRGKYTQLKQDFETANTTAKRKERQSVGPTSASASATPMNSSSAFDDTRHSPRTSAGTTTEVRVQAIKQVDNSELYTKEALEREKLQGALEIEAEMRDLKSTYKEFNDLVQHQQQGIDTMASNVQDARVHVEKGIVELQEASAHQKSSRKKLCIALIIIVVLAVVVAVAAYLGTR